MSVVLSYIEESINQQTENLAELEEEICRIREEDQMHFSNNSVKLF